MRPCCTTIAARTSLPRAEARNPPDARRLAVAEAAADDRQHASLEPPAAEDVRLRHPDAVLERRDGARHRLPRPRPARSDPKVTQDDAGRRRSSWGGCGGLRRGLRRSRSRSRRRARRRDRARYRHGNGHRCGRRRHGRRRRRHGRGRRRSTSGGGSERVSPVDAAGGARGCPGADCKPVRVLDVGAVAGRVQPAVEHRLGARVPGRDVLAPAARDTARLHPLGGRASNRRRGIAVGHVAVLGHVARFPDGRTVERTRDDERPQPERRAVGVDELDRLCGEVRLGRFPNRSLANSLLRASSRRHGA